VTRNREVVLIKQYRHGVRDVLLEIPGGIVEPGDTPLDAAIRELKEETGYTAKEMVFLGATHANPPL
jgi:8-oxo-dGTP pyrophosphatase MutT (NUDIX family)